MSCCTMLLLLAGIVGSIVVGGAVGAVAYYFPTLCDPIIVILAFWSLLAVIAGSVTGVILIVLALAPDPKRA